MGMLLPLITLSISLAVLIEDGYGAVLLWIAGIGCSAFLVVCLLLWWLLRERTAQ